MRLYRVTKIHRTEHFAAAKELDSKGLHWSDSSNELTISLQGGSQDYRLILDEDEMEELISFYKRRSLNVFDR